MSMRFVSLWLSDGRAVRLAESRAQNVPSPDHPSLENIRFERQTAMSEWRLSAIGQSDDGCEVEFDVAFSALTSAFGVEAADRSLTGSASTVVNSLASGHFEQAGRLAGTVAIDGVHHAFAGFGNRDKAWGPRRTDGAHGMRYWRWFSMNFGNDFHMGGIRVGTGAGDLERGRWFRDGQQPLEILSVLGARLGLSAAGDDLHIGETQFARAEEATAYVEQFPL